MARDRRTVIYRAWCPGAGESRDRGYGEYGALDAPNAARIHAERMTAAAWRHATRKCKRHTDHHVTVLVQSESGRTDSFVVRRTMQPVFEVIA